MIVLSLTTAFALDCTSRNLESCTAVNDVAAQLAITNPGFVVDGAAQQRFATETIYNHFEEIRTTAAINGCENGGVVIESVFSGAYTASATWSGEWASDLETGTAFGLVDRDSKTWGGSYLGDDTGTVGDLFASYDSQGNLIGNHDDGFVAGRWMRIKGLRGLYVAVQGTCVADPSEALATWYGTDVVAPFSGVILPVDGTITTLGTGTAALLGNDLTDLGDDGIESPSNFGTNFDYIDIFANDEPFFGGGEGAFNVFDNSVGSGNSKWCCTNPSDAAPLFVGVEFANPVELTHFTIASGNDSPARDPLHWHIEGSDNGIDWSPIFIQDATTAIFTARNQVMRVDLDVAAPSFTHFRYIVFDTAAIRHQVNEIELFGNVLVD